MAMLSEIDDIKKKLQKLEDETKFKMKQMEESFALFRDVIIRMQKEKAELERRNILLEKEKKLLIEEKKKMLSAPIENAIEKINKGVIKPIKDEFNDTIQLVQEALKEDDSEDVNYIEIPEQKKQEPKQVDVAAENNKKNKVVQWFREKHGIEEKEKLQKTKKQKKIVAS
ncbi:MAG: hypothetical protein HZB67_01955 [Candidatus Aenigmarchaeota archaeon]|nr:hypothetical protein [Candidatus Aenigmarchaeota archaeon]